MIFLDGIIYSLQKRGGISTYFDMLVGELERRGQEHKLLAHDEIGMFPSALVRKSRLFERYRRVAVPDEARVFLSSYYRRPANDRIPVVTTLHDFVYEAVLSGPKVLFHSRQKFASIRRASDIICVSEATKADLFRFFGRPKGHVQVVHNGVSDDYFRLDGADGHDGFLLYAGNRRLYKNFSLLLETLPLLPELDLVCVGGECWTEQERAETEAALKGELRIERGVSSMRLNKLYNSAVCLVYPSLYEGFGIPVIEAMRAGCPVVAANCAAVKEAGGSALLVAANSEPSEMAEQIGRCMSQERHALVQGGLARASRFSWKRTHTATAAILEKYL